MAAVTPVPFEHLRDTHLTLDREYSGGSNKNLSDDPLARLLPVGNQGGFRYVGSPQAQSVRLVVLYTSGHDPDWPDQIDPQTGDFTYYGDNKTPGSSLHETKRRGNLLLRDIFAWSRGTPADRLRVPPILLFEKTGRGRGVRFRGLLAPGSHRLTSQDELVAIWRTTRQHRFQNYRAHFTVLNVAEVSREWLTDIIAGEPLSAHCPDAWRRWVSGRIYDALEAPRTVDHRSVEAQYPASAAGMAVLRAIHAHFAGAPTAFEHLAADLWKWHDANVASIEVTRASRDGGMDAHGTYALGPAPDPIYIDFALEAKCFEPRGGGVGVRLVSRLISRLKHRDFGVFVTTAHIGQQAYQEVRSDRHPVVFITGGDIVDILRRRGVTTLEEVSAFLREGYPLPTPDYRAMDVTVRVETPEPHSATDPSPEPAVKASESR